MTLTAIERAVLPHTHSEIREALHGKGYWVGSLPLTSQYSADWNSLTAASALLPPDLYAPGTGRYRSFDRFTARVTPVGVTLARSDQAVAYFQAADYNPELGGVQRRYAPSSVLDPSHAVLRELTGLVLPALADLLACPTFAINVHHVRYLATLGAAARNSPSGLHKDGERFISVHLLGRRDIQGGTNRIADNEQRPLSEFVLQEPADSFIIDDTRVWHAVDDIIVQPGASRGSRDILLLDYLPDIP